MALMSSSTSIKESDVTGDNIPYEIAATTHETHGLPIDTLRTIFQGQRLLMDKYYSLETRNMSFPVDTADCGDLDSRLVQARLHEMFGFLVRELGEAMQELKSKPWKQGWAQTDRDKFMEEMADSLHFFVEMCITAGMSADDLFEWYFKAWGKNRDRQENGYRDARSAVEVAAG